MLVVPVRASVNDVENEQSLSGKHLVTLKRCFQARVALTGFQRKSAKFGKDSEAWPGPLTLEVKSGSDFSK